MCSSALQVSITTLYGFLIVLVLWEKKLMKVYMCKIVKGFFFKIEKWIYLISLGVSGVLLAYTDPLSYIRQQIEA